MNGAEVKPPPGNEVIKEMWIEAAQEFEKICGQSLEKGKFKSFDDVRKEIESTEKASYVDNLNKDKWDRAKDAAIKVLRGLKHLIGMASGAVSFVCQESRSP